jgi:hypothetical protein
MKKFITILATALILTISQSFAKDQYKVEIGKSLIFGSIMVNVTDTVEQITWTGEVEAKDTTYLKNADFYKMDGNLTYIGRNKEVRELREINLFSAIWTITKLVFITLACIFFSIFIFVDLTRHW